MGSVPPSGVVGASAEFSRLSSSTSSSTSSFTSGESGGGGGVHAASSGSASAPAGPAFSFLPSEEDAEEGDSPAVSPAVPLDDSEPSESMSTSNSDDRG